MCSGSVVKSVVGREASLGRRSPGFAVVSLGHEHQVGVHRGEACRLVRRLAAVAAEGRSHSCHQGLAAGHRQKGCEEDPAVGLILPEALDLACDLACRAGPAAPEAEELDLGRLDRRP